MLLSVFDIGNSFSVVKALDFPEGFAVEGLRDVQPWVHILRSTRLLFEVEKRIRNLIIMLEGFEEKIYGCHSVYLVL